MRADALLRTSPSRAVQRRLGLALRARVAGEDAPQRARQIWGAEGERWFTPADPIWRVHADASMFPGGLAALLLQSLHPLAMAGVAGHSGYKGDPWGRLQRTSHYLAVTTFGTVDDAARAIEVVRSVHHRVRGKDERGRPYNAADPHLLRWVHVAEISSFLAAFQAYAATPLTAEEADLYVEQASRSASLLGATDLPMTVAELDAAMASYRPELESTRAAREATRFMLLNPPVPIVARPGYALIAAGGVALLPTWARRALKLPLYGPGRVVAERAGAVSATLVRWGMAGLEERRPSERDPA
jgi:uncharacterized protein (DUF2236 family)